MATSDDGSPRGRAGGRCGCGGGGARPDLLLTLILAAALCSASYCLGVWHNSRGAADSRVLAPSAAVAVAVAAPGGAASCAGLGGLPFPGDDGDPLDFETRHAAEAAGLSVSSSAATTPRTRRALREAEPGGTGHHRRGASAVLA